MAQTAQTVFEEGMKKIKIAATGVGILVTLYAAVICISVIQNGIGGWDGRSMEETLRVEPDQATIKDLESLSKQRVMQLFYAAKTPDLADMKGEYQIGLMRVGVMARMVEMYIHRIMGPGPCKGLAFFPFEKEKGSGYTMFAVKEEYGKEVLVRSHRMVTHVKPSNMDEKKSFYLDYGAYDKKPIGSIQGEIRRINDNIYLGMGYTTAIGGALNPIPFVLFGKPNKWIGPDTSE
jgi:hypothetical protein